MVKTCPICGTNNDDEIFWCENCNTTLLNSRALVTNNKIKNNQHAVVHKQELKRHYMEKILEAEDYEFLYEKEKINTKPIITFIIFIATIFVVTAMLFNTFLSTDLKDIQLEGSWELRSMEVNGENIPNVYSSMTMTFYSDGTYELSSDISPSMSSPEISSQPTTQSTQNTQNPPQTAEQADIEQYPQTTQSASPYSQITRSDGTSETIDQTVSNNEELKEDQTLTIKGTWKVDDGKLYIQPAKVSNLGTTPNEATQQPISNSPAEYELVQQDKRIILNIKSSTGTTSLILEKTS